MWYEREKLEWVLKGENPFKLQPLWPEFQTNHHANLSHTEHHTQGQIQHGKLQRPWGEMKDDIMTWTLTPHLFSSDSSDSCIISLYPRFSLSLSHKSLQPLRSNACCHYMSTAFSHTVILCHLIEIINCPTSPLTYCFNELTFRWNAQSSHWADIR